MIRKWTINIAAIITIVAIGWDIVAYMYGSNSTFSVVFTDWSRSFPTFAFLWGFLMGHWFWPARGTED